MASVIITVLHGQVIVKTKIFSLRSRARDVAPRGGYAMSDGVELVQRFRDTQGEAKGLIPATKEIYQHLVDNHVQTCRVTETDGDRYAIVPYLFATADTADACGASAARGQTTSPSKGSARCRARPHLSTSRRSSST
jgi:hypothetical protein